MKVLVLFCVSTLAWAQGEKAGIDLEKDNFIDDLWDRLGKNANNSVGIQELENFFKRYDSKNSNPPDCNLFEFDWIGGNTTVPTEFGVPVNHSIVFFKLLDIDNFVTESPDLYERITSRDLQNIVELGDDDFVGAINETQFSWAFSRLLRGSSFGKMYVDFRPTLGTSLYDDYLGPDDWLNVYDDLDEDGNGAVNANEFVASWVARGYGGEDQGRAVFYFLQLETSGYLYREEWALLFVVFDVDQDGFLAIEEVLLMDWLMHGDFPEDFRDMDADELRRIMKDAIGNAH